MSQTTMNLADWLALLHHDLERATYLQRKREETAKLNGDPAPIALNLSRVQVELNVLTETDTKASVSGSLLKVITSSLGVEEKHQATHKLVLTLESPVPLTLGDATEKPLLGSDT